MCHNEIVLRAHNKDNNMGSTINAIGSVYMIV